MDDITFAPLSARHLAEIEGWSPASAVDMLLKQPGANSNGADTSSQGWVALRGSEPIAVAIVTSDHQQGGYLDFFVKPSERRHGIGGHIVEHALAQPEVTSLRQLRALVEFDNTSAQKILSRRGFSSIGYSADDRLEFERH